jgi:hypothetical protein
MGWEEHASKGSRTQKQVGGRWRADRRAEEGEREETERTHWEGSAGSILAGGTGASTAVGATLRPGARPAEPEAPAEAEEGPAPAAPAGEEEGPAPVPAAA